MKAFFAPPAATPPVAPPSGPGGWSGLASWKKLSILSGVAAGGILVVVWPGAFLPSGTSVTTAHDTAHTAAPISDFQAAPPVQNVVDRAMGGPAPDTKAPPPRPRIVPAEMASYSGPTIPVNTTAPITAGPASRKVAADDDEAAALGPNAAVTTNRATIVRHPDYVIRAGDVIPCLPIDAQNSSRPSFTTCRVPEWFRGTNQRRGLLPPGSRMFGSIRQGLAAGQERLGISYSLIQTPWFNMPVESPAGDALGRGGVDGDVQTFFWDRAGAVALYALIDTTVGIGQNAAANALSRSQSGIGNNTNLNFQSQSQSLAGREFDATINKPPVLTRDQALPVTVTVGQDLDFYGACQVALRVDPMACPEQSR